MIGAAALLAALGCAVMAAWRAPRAKPLRLARIGALSDVSHAAIGLALLFAAYHLFAHAISLAHMRAPLWIALPGAALVIAGSVALDALEQQPEQDGEDG